MSTPEGPAVRRWLLAVPFLALAGHAASAAGPGLGVPVPAEEVRAWDVSIMPDGRGLPEGKGSVADGAKVYAERCVTCHGDKGQGHEKIQGLHIAGGTGSLATDKPVKSVGSFWPYASTLFDYVRRAMPVDKPGLLTDDEVYAVSAYVLHLNGILAPDAALSRDSLAKVAMPNAGGFISWWPKPGR